MYLRFLKGYQYALTLLEKILMVICILLLLIVVFLYAVEIFTRYFLHYSSTVSAELGLILMTWMYFLGFVILFKRGEDVVMEYFFRLLPPRARELLEWLIQGAILLFLTVLTWKAIQFYFMTSTMEHPFLPIRYSYTVQPVLAGSILAILVSLYFILEKAGRLLTRVDPQSKAMTEFTQRPAE
jgi:TRAP-type C4-dicarboxylate transport system permease small subunit